MMAYSKDVTNTTSFFFVVALLLFYYDASSSLLVLSECGHCNCFTHVGTAVPCLCAWPLLHPPEAASCFRPL
jgi:hypothetical protein